jgi:hypothetical protein
VLKVGEMSLSKILIIFLTIAIVSGCQLFSPDNVKVVVPAHLGSEYWALSPKGALMWLDNETLLCIEGKKKSILTTKDIEKEIPLEDVGAIAAEVRNLLSRAEKIYYQDKPSTLYLLSQDAEANLVKGYAINDIENLENVLEGLDYVSVPPYRPKGIPERRILSPNQKYYYNMSGESLTIYKAENDEKVAEFKTESPYFLAAEGWASDSSGIYFHIYGVAFASASAPKGIRKLEVPK